MIGIVGAGIAGLASALALRKAGHQVTVYERRSSVGDDRGNAGLLQIPPHAQEALAQLGFDEQIRAGGFVVRSVTLCHADGTPIGTFPGADGAYYYLHRHTLFHTLLASARQHGVGIRYGSTLTGVEDTDEQVTALFCDGTRRSVELLVGADGVRSQIRAVVDPATVPSYTGQWFVHALTSPGGPVYSEPEQFQVVRDERGHSFGWITTDDGTTHWWLRITADPLPDPFVQADATTQEELLAAAPRGCPAAEIITATCGDLSSYNAYAVPAGGRWAAGRLVLAGDAAHACSPSASQSVGLAIEDAVTLARALRDVPQSVLAALATYERMRRARAERAIAAGNPHRGITPGPRYPIEWDSSATAETAEQVHSEHALS